MRINKNQIGYVFTVNGKDVGFLQGPRLVDHLAKVFATTIKAEVVDVYFQKAPEATPPQRVYVTTINNGPNPTKVEIRP